ncbi:MAG: DUF5615 family PIN-like protein [Acidimicrobiales bacterium]
MKLLVDEMYPLRLAQVLRALGMEASTAGELAIVGRSDLELFAIAAAEGYVLLTENVADFARIAAEHLGAGGHHAGVLIGLSWRFSPRPGGITTIAAAVQAVATEVVGDRVLYLKAPAP